MSTMEVSRRLLVGALLMVACGGGTTSATPDGGADDFRDDGRDDGGDAGKDGGTTPAPIAWYPCPLLTDGTTAGAQCAVVKERLRHGDAASRTIDLFVKRYPATRPRRGQLWVLAGGPGMASTRVEERAVKMWQQSDDLDVYTLDHRGTWRSTLLDCPKAIASQPTDFIARALACKNELVDVWGADLAAFNTTEAAADVLELIGRTRAPGDTVLVYGNSYGTYWANRMMQLDAPAVDAWVLDGMLDPTAIRTSVDFLRGEEAGRNLLEDCRKDTVCTAKLGPDPHARAMQILDGMCKPLIRGNVQYRLWQAVEQPPARDLIPALLHRIERCAPADISAWQGFEKWLDGNVSPFVYPRYNTALEIHILSSEVFPRVATNSEIGAVLGAELFVSVGTYISYRVLMPQWPVYAPDQHARKLGSTDAPILFIEGSYDTRTPPAMSRSAAAHFNGPKQHLVMFPRIAHTVVRESQDVGDGVTCGIRVTVDFLRDPSKLPDTSCVDGAPHPAFGGRPATVTQIFGTTDAWGD